jgi:hypothetical protein
MPLVTATFTTGGSVVITEEVEVAAIALLNTNLAALNALLISTLTPAPDGVAVPGSIAQSANLSYQTLVDVSTHLGQINGNLEKLQLAVGKTNTELEKLNKAAGISNSHANKANVTNALATIAAIDNYQFNQQVVTETQIAAGQEPTKVVPQDFLANIQKKVSDIANLDGAMAATGIVIQGAVTATTEGFKLATEIALDTAVGKKLVEYYYEGEIAVVSVFSKEKADRLLRENKHRINMAKTGAVPTPPVAPD